jgi:hypothetical protein
MIARTVLAVLLLATLGCGATLLDPMARKSSLEQSQREYTDLIRWGDIDRAVKYVDPTLRRDFISHIEAYEDLRISDYEIMEIDWNAGTEDDERIAVTVTYHGFSEATLLEKEFKERQEWYNAGGKLSNVWLVRPEIEHLIEAIEGGRP